MSLNKLLLTNQSLDPQVAINNTRSTLESMRDILSLEISQKVSRHDEHNFFYQLKQHRKHYYEKKAPHLLPTLNCPVEESIDQRSLILIAKHHDLVLASLRLTPRPFELENFNIHEIDFDSYNGYAEIGRLTMNTNLDNLSSALLSRYLLCAAGLIGIESCSYQGIAAICRPPRVSFFEKFGLKSQAVFFSNSKNSIYHFLSANMHDILLTTSNLQASESHLRNRLRRSLIDRQSR